MSDELVQSQEVLTQIGKDMAAKSTAGTLQMGNEARSYEDNSPIGGDLTSDLTVESNFWDEEGQSSNEDHDAESREEPGESESLIDEEVEEDLTTEEDVSKEGQPKTIKFKSDGEEFEATEEDAARALSLEKASRQALTERGKLRKQLKEFKGQKEELAKYKASWEKLENLRQDPEKLISVLMDKPIDEIKRQIAQEYMQYEDASPEMKSIIDQKREMDELKREYQRQQREAEQSRQDLDNRNYRAEKSELKNSLTQEMSKYSFEVGDANIENGLNEMLWESSLHTLRKFHKQYGKITPKMINKAVENSYRKLSAGRSKSEEAKIASNAAAQQADAKQKAAAAASQNYEKPRSNITKDMSKLDPMSLFRNHFKR